jgi:hypothetical protein
MERSAIRDSFANGPNKIPSSPERKTQKMPLSTRRAAKRGTPRSLFATARWQPTRVREFIPHESGLGLANLNHVHANPIDAELPFPKLPANRTYGGHRGIDAIDPCETLANRS